MSAQQLMYFILPSQYRRAANERLCNLDAVLHGVAWVFVKTHHPSLFRCDGVVLFLPGLPPAAYAALSLAVAGLPPESRSGADVDCVGGVRTKDLFG